MRAITVLALGPAFAAWSFPALAQDVPGLENCMAEKQIERRTGCLQSNINFLKTTITSELGKARAEAQSKIDDATKQVDALKLVVSGLEEQIRQLKTQAEEAKREAAGEKTSTKSDKTGPK